MKKIKNQFYYVGISVKNKFFKTIKKNIIFLIGLVTTIIVANSIIYFAQPIENKIIYTNWILLINSSIAAALSAIVVVIKLLKQKILDQHAKTHIALTIGLILWLCANIQWWIYESNDMIPDVPTGADLFWLSAYPFFIYSIYSVFKEFYKKYKSKKIFFACLFCGISLVLYTIFIANHLSVLTSQSGRFLFATVISYPILNVILIIPAISMLAGFRKEPKLAIPRICESLSLISLVIADNWFLIIFLSNTIEAIWYSNLLIVDHYIIISAGLFGNIIFLNPLHNKCSLKLKYLIKIGINEPIIPIIILAYVIATIILFATIYNKNNDYNSNNIFSTSDNNTIKIGVLLGLSGASYESGLIQRDIFNRAVDDINENFSKSKISKRIALQFADTQINHDVALEKVKELVGKGIKIIIGPQTSDELKKIMPYADNQKVLIISQSSTAPKLAKIDNIYRLLQNDIYQGPQIAEKMHHDGIKIVIPIWLNNQYGTELYDTTKNSFEKLGGKFIQGVKYDPNIGQFAGSLHRINFMIWDQTLKNISKAISNAKEHIGGLKPYSKIGVYLISYGELVPLFLQAPSHNDLDEVKWYGSEATAKNQRLLKHEKAAEFAAKTNFTTPALSYNTTNKNLKLLENVTKHPNMDASDVNSYDAVWIAALTASISQNTTFVNLKDNFNKTISSYHGLSGNIKLDKYGDRIASYDFWTLKKNSSKGYEWVK
jgi:ABC-type branched-subunit amino acid transport system substrate-binding protein